ncbi:MAG: hypothetical protein AVDCRST_MAG73-2722 [uncultured Thermomicrobiales bacterium]|uniref:Response regulatory domain-containing protein n=1 Tax=uncultured Thermomicrobiales bacterium TaxID=1645740 RepID=A0A6J4UFA6_9BACT|nr:MAG: hypothetical protein AVDCRST_MAG73-2722 [uncultured Thermomicrobiales bacterium]
MNAPPPPHNRSDPAGPAPDLVILNRDLFFGVRLGNTLRDAGYRVAFAPHTAAFLTHLRAPAPPRLGIVDLGAGPDWAAVADFTADLGAATPILVFGPHKDIAGFRAAKAAGVARVVSNGEFHRDVLGLVARYVLPANTGPCPST